MRIVMDPFNEKVGYKVPSPEADIVTTSHDHYDHNYIETVRGRFTRINTSGVHNSHGVSIQGVPVYHDEAGGTKRGNNIIFTFRVDGLIVCHCGDLGHALSAAQVEAVGPVDVLLVPVGGFYTIDYQTAAKTVEALKPAVTIPMHFKTAAIDMPIAEVDPFLAAMGGGTRLGRQEVELNKQNIGEYSGVLVLNYE
ncbi:metallo-beta-lactamase [Lucifera butyrica]|uniref:Metallo-beta-lactamase n=1 Tax=Lucifera butyrica TaxID=1351585 RepID=A0A498R9F1_9FIRM|nr:metallo-beta-lactamase [Lucifera butyrica]